MLYLCNYEKNTINIFAMIKVIYSKEKDHFPADHISYIAYHFGFRYSLNITIYTGTIVFGGAMSIVTLASRNYHHQHPVNCSCNGKASHYQLIYLEKRMVFTIWPDACRHF